MSSEPLRRGTPIRSISAVLPVYNEAPNILQVVEATIDALSDAAPDFEVIIIDDGCTDSTPRLADELAKRHPQVKVIHHPKNRGYGSAWRSGIAAASKQYIFFMDADRQFDPAEIARLVQWGDAYDVVAGYRIRRNDPFYRFLIGICFAILVRLLFRVRLRDLNCGFKLYRTSLLQSLTLAITGVLINTEIQYRVQQRGARVREVGVHHYPRRAGKQAGARVRVYVRAAWELIALRRRLNAEQRALREALRPRNTPTADVTRTDDATEKESDGQ